MVPNIVTEYIFKKRWGNLSKDSWWLCRVFKNRLRLVHLWLCLTYRHLGSLRFIHWQKCNKTFQGCKTPDHKIVSQMRTGDFLMWMIVWLTNEIIVLDDHEIEWQYWEGQRPSIQSIFMKGSFPPIHTDGLKCHIALIAFLVWRPWLLLSLHLFRSLHRQLILRNWWNLKYLTIDHRTIFESWGWW